MYHGEKSCGKLWKPIEKPLKHPGLWVFLKNTGVWTNFGLMECNLLSLSTLDPISTIPEWVGEMGSNVLRDKRLCSIGSKLVQTPGIPSDSRLHC